MEELAEQTVVHVVDRSGEMARVMHMVSALYTVSLRTGHSLVAVHARQ
jgi:hypothetical protein